MKNIFALFVLFIFNYQSIYAQCTNSGSAFTASSTATNINCASNDGIITVNASFGWINPSAANGTGYSYRIVSGPITRPIQTSNVFSALVVGTYTVRVYNCNGDSVTNSNITIGGTYNSIAAAPFAYKSICANQNRVKVNASGGKAPYTYAIVSAPAGSTPVISGDTIKGLTAGTLSVNTIDFCGNVYNSEVVVETHNPVTITRADLYWATCVGATSNLVGGFSGPALVRTVYSYAPLPYGPFYNFDTTKIDYYYNGTLLSTTYRSGSEMNRAFSYAYMGFGEYKWITKSQCGDLIDRDSVIIGNPSNGVNNRIGSNVPYGINFECSFFDIRTDMRRYMPGIGYGQVIDIINLPARFTIISGPAGTIGRSHVATSSSDTFDNMPYGSYLIQMRDTCGITDTLSFTQNAPTFTLSPNATSCGNGCHPAAIGKSWYNMQALFPNLPKTNPVKYTFLSGPSSLWFSYPSSFVDSVSDNRLLIPLTQGTYTIAVANACGNLDTIVLNNTACNFNKATPTVNPVITPVCGDLGNIKLNLTPRTGLCGSEIYNRPFSISNISKPIGSTVPTSQSYLTTSSDYFINQPAGSYTFRLTGSPTPTSSQPYYITVGRYPHNNGQLYSNPTFPIDNIYSTQLSFIGTLDTAKMRMWDTSFTIVVPNKVLSPNASVAYRCKDGSPGGNLIVHPSANGIAPFRYQYSTASATGPWSSFQSDTLISIATSLSVGSNVWIKETDTCGSSMVTNSTVVNLSSSGITNICDTGIVTLTPFLYNNEFQYELYKVSTGVSSYFTGTATPITVNLGTFANMGEYQIRIRLRGSTGVGCIVDTIKYMLFNPKSAPTTSAVAYCQYTATSLLTATGTTGTNLLWYNSPTGGVGSSTAPTPSSASFGSTTYYVSQGLTLTSGVCESARTPLAVTINAAPAKPIVSSPIVRCQNDTATISLSATGTSLKWYAAATGGSSITKPTPTSTTSGTTTYYVSQTESVYNCESLRESLAVTINPQPAAPTITTPIAYCQNATTATALTATGSSIKWYSSATSTSGSSTAPTPSTTMLGATTYFVSQTNSFSCESNKAAIVVNINPLPIAPTVVTPINYCINSLTTSLTATGSNLKWYSTSTGGTAVSSITPSSSATGNTDYFVSQTNSFTCEGPRARLTVQVQPLPLVNITSLSSTGFIFCRDKAISLKANAPTATSYQWSYNSLSLLSETNDTIVANKSGIFKIVVKDIYGCKNADSVSVRKDSSMIPVLSPVEITICEEGSQLLTVNPGFVGWTFEWVRDGINFAPAGSINLKNANLLGIYTAIVVNRVGCIDTTNEAHISYYPRPLKPTIINRDPILEVPNVYRHYQWYRNGVKLISTNFSRYTVLSSGSYHVEITDANGCLNQSDTVIITNTTGINTSLLKSELKIYPNPSRNIVYIEAPVTVNVKVTDITGRTIIAEKDVKQIDLQAYADGNYILIISDQENNLITVEKISKMP